MQSHPHNHQHQHQHQFCPLYKQIRQCVLEKARVIEDQCLTSVGSHEKGYEKESVSADETDQRQHHQQQYRFMLRAI